MTTWPARWVYDTAAPLANTRGIGIRHVLRAPIDRLSADDTSLTPATQPIISISTGSTVSSAVDLA